MNNPSSAATVFYDGHCAICQKIRKIIQLADIQKRIRLIDLWSISTSNEFRNLDIQKLVKELNLVDRDGKFYTGYFAFKQIAKLVLLFTPFYLLSYLPGTNYLGVKVYKFISKNRYRFGCETCGKLYCKIHLLHN